MIKISFGFQDKKFDISEWFFTVCTDIQQQPNSYDCGILASFFGRQILDGKSMIECNCVDERKFFKSLLTIDYYPIKRTGKLDKKAIDYSRFDAILKETFGSFDVFYAKSKEIFIFVYFNMVNNHCSLITYFFHQLHELHF